ncbi:MAG: hypothetical protein OXH56_02655 [Gemmatimonadetes bacterium]|nr:hypothetical protein [Gemmatimonadota bacterium]
MRYRFHLAVLGLIMTAFIANDVAAQRGGFGRGGGRGQNNEMMERVRAVSTFPVDRIWHVLSIRMDTTDQQVLQLRAVVKEASSQKVALVEQATKTEDWNWLREQLEANEKQFMENLKGMLSTDEIKTLEQLVEEASRLVPGMQGRSRR